MSAAPAGLDLVRIRARLEERRAELMAYSEETAEARKAVELDQQAIGRLSRQDALQQQAMAKAQDARRSAELRRIAAALERIDGGDYGWCAGCGEEIAAKRLEIDPTADHCVACAK